MDIVGVLDVPLFPVEPISCASVCVCVCVPRYVCVKERERERERISVDLCWSGNIIAEERLVSAVYQNALEALYSCICMLYIPAVLVL